MRRLFLFCICFYSAVASATLTPNASTVEDAQLSCQAQAQNEINFGLYGSECAFFAIGDTAQCYDAVDSASSNSLTFTDGSVRPFSGWYSVQRYKTGSHAGEYRCGPFTSASEAANHWNYSNTCTASDDRLYDYSGTGYCDVDCGKLVFFSGSPQTSNDPPAAYYLDSDRYQQSFYNDPPVCISPTDVETLTHASCWDADNFQFDAYYAAPNSEHNVLCPVHVSVTHTDLVAANNGLCSYPNDPISNQGDALEWVVQNYAYDSYTAFFSDLSNKYELGVPTGEHFDVPSTVFTDVASPAYCDFSVSSSSSSSSTSTSSSSGTGSSSSSSSGSASSSSSSTSSGSGSSSSGSASSSSSSSSGSGSSSSSSSGSASGGDTCDVEPVCSGDAIQCAQLIQIWRDRCEYTTLPDVDVSAPDLQPVPEDEVQVDQVIDNTIMNQQSDYVAVCPDPIDLTLMGHDLSFSYDVMCDFAERTYALNILVASIMAFVIVGRFIAGGM